MAVGTDENVKVIETEEVGEDGTIHKITKTITTHFIEETVDDQGTSTISHDSGSAGRRRASASSSSSSNSSCSDINSHLVCECVTPSGEKSTPIISDNKDGTYTVDINASEPGVHTIDVELNGEKIPGSPYLVRIVQAADKKKVHFYGQGLSSGLLNDFEGIFYVDTKGAGPGDLKVRVHGPKNGFKVVISKNIASERVVNVQYEPTVPGVYTINVFWSGEHAEGSPKQVFLTNDENELEKWKNDHERRSSSSSSD